MYQVAQYISGVVTQPTEPVWRTTKSQPQAGRSPKKTQGRSRSLEHCIQAQPHPIHDLLKVHDRPATM
jgi:hypothetical protein